MKKIYFFIGTTTELIKLAPVIKELERRKINFKIITSGQTEVKFEELSFLIKKRKADISLGNKNKKSSLFAFFVWSFFTIFKTPTLRKEFKGLNFENSYFIVHGDPVSSLIGAIVAKFYNLKLVHIESGLRSFNFFEPFPEEICRYFISKLADIHFCPNEWALKNLSNIRGEKINTFENTMIDSFSSLPKNNKVYEKDLKIKNKKYFVLILHRQEHVIFGKEKSEKLIKFIFQQMKKDLYCVFINHVTTSNFLESIRFELQDNQKKRVIFASRLKYMDFVSLIQNSQFLVTDGGSNQEEAYYMGLPCLLIRNYTERIEGLGQNVVLSRSNKNKIKLFMQNYKKYQKKKVEFEKSPSKIIVDYLVSN